MQSGVEIVSGVSGMIGGGSEAILTTPACGTGVGCLAPAAGVGTAIVSAAVATHGAFVGVNILNNIFRHGNSASSTKPQHGYEIVDQTGDVKKVGVSGQKLNQNGTSPRANSQVNKVNKAGSNQVEARIKKQNVSNRKQILEWERKQAERRRKEGHSMEMHQRP